MRDGFSAILPDAEVLVMGEHNDGYEWHFIDKPNHHNSASSDPNHDNSANSIPDLYHFHHTSHGSTFPVPTSTSIPSTTLPSSPATTVTSHLHTMSILLVGKRR
jgi:hypothetical protein